MCSKTCTVSLRLCSATLSKATEGYGDMATGRLWLFLWAQDLSLLHIRGTPSQKDTPARYDQETGEMCR